MNTATNTDRVLNDIRQAALDMIPGMDKKTASILALAAASAALEIYPDSELSIDRADFRGILNQIIGD